MWLESGRYLFIALDRYREAQGQAIESWERLGEVQTIGPDRRGGARWLLNRPKG